MTSAATRRRQPIQHCSTDTFNFALKYLDTDTDDLAEVSDDVFNRERRVLFTIATTFPWKK